MQSGAGYVLRQRHLVISKNEVTRCRVLGDKIPNTIQPRKYSIGGG